MKRVTIILILVSIFLNAGAQTLIRVGMLKIDNIKISSLIQILPKMAANFILWIALALYVISYFIWMIILSKTEVSFAYAFSGLGLVIVTIMGSILLKENISLVRLIGIFLIVIGVTIVARS